MDSVHYEKVEKISAVYVATDATFIEMDFPIGMETMPTAIMKFGKTLHLLTPEYWAWFNHKYHLMENALTRKKISETAFAEILDRISKLYNQAVAIYGKEMLDAAVRTADVRKLDELIKRENAVTGCNQGNGGSRHSVPSLVVERGSQPARKPASAPSAPARSQAIEKVDAICDRALALGWTRDQLYRMDGVAYRDWGLVRFLDPDDEIGEITLQRIEIINRKSGRPLCFYNHCVDQPWLRKSCKAGVQHES